MFFLTVLRDAVAAPAAAVLFSFEPHFANLNANDAELADYGFAPVGGRFLPVYGVRGSFTYDSGLVVGMFAASGFGSAQDDATPVPTTTTWTKIGYTLGWAGWGPLVASADLGFGALTHTVGSTAQGGALLYLGPFLHPHLAVVPLSAPARLSVSAGWLMQLPLSEPHQQPLWEEDFSRPLVHGPTIAINVGMGT